MGLSAGFVLRDEGLVAVTEEELFGPREPRRHATSFREAAALDALAQIAPGDLLVHVEHGIGVYRGLVILEVGRMREEMLRLEYADGDRLFVPAHRLNLIQRYVSGDGPLPEIDKLGGVSWERTKSGVRRRVRDMAKELLAVHAARELQPGFSFPPRDRALEEFEPPSPTRRRRTRGPRSRTCSQTWCGRGRWTGWCAATSATARPRWRRAPRTRR